MAAYSQDLRDRVLTACMRGDRPIDIAKRYDVSRVWVYQVWNRYKKTGKRVSLPIGGYRRSRLEGYDDLLKGWIEEQPTMTLAEMCDRLKKMGLQIGIPALWYRLDQLGLTLKNNPARRRAKRNLATQKA